jgi:hypothetical protein
VLLLPAVVVREGSEGLEREDGGGRGGRRENVRNDTPRPEVTVRGRHAHERGSRSSVLEAVHIVRARGIAQNSDAEVERIM